MRYIPSSSNLLGLTPTPRKSDDSFLLGFPKPFITIFHLRIWNSKFKNFVRSQIW